MHWGVRLGALLSLATIGPNPAAAKSAGDGYVTGFVTLNNGIVFFSQSGPISGSTLACDVGGIPQRWGLDVTTAIGQAIFSLLLTAKNTHEIIKITGSGSCPTGSSSEAPGIIVTDDIQ